jgi:hypothetical protein
MVKCFCHKPRFYTFGCRKVKKIFWGCIKIIRYNSHQDPQHSVRKNSFLEKSGLTIHDAMIFSKSYLDELNMWTVRRYRHGLMQFYKRDTYKVLKQTKFLWETFKKSLSGEILIDESFFGRTVKYNKGKSHKRLRA